MRKHLFLFFSLLFLLSSCTFFNPAKLEQPKVSLSSIKLLPSDSLKPQFEIGLNILNPNKISLGFEGLYYTMSIEGYEVIGGVTNDLPTIPGYGEETVYLNASVDLRRSLSLLSLFVKEKRKTASYTFNAELAPKGILPKIKISETGEFNF